jgi:kelch-like protein 10
MCFFGDKKKILFYDVEMDHWNYIIMPQHYSNFEFNYYAAAASLPNGDILITGGGASKTVFKISLKNQKIQITLLKSLNHSRKEHAAVYLNHRVFVMGGYNSESKEMLKSCEMYNPESDTWKIMASLNRVKCAFAATSANDRYIYAFGGFDGVRRLD